MNTHADGDQLFVGRVQLIHAYKGGSSFGEVAALERMLAAIDARRFVSGHSEIQDRETHRPKRPWPG